MVKKTQIVDSLKHESAKRANVPADPEEPYIPEADKRPKKYVPDIRNREGPVLSWDRTENLEKIETNAYPLYIHEKVHPESWIQQLRSTPPVVQMNSI